MYWDDQEALNLYDAADWSIWMELINVVLLWRLTYEEYWGVGKREAPKGVSQQKWLERDVEDRLALSVLKMLDALTVDAAVADGGSLEFESDEHVRKFREILRKHSKSVIVRDRIALELAARGAEQLKGADQRALRLVGLLMGPRVTPRAASYVGRVTHLFILGFEIETGIMCRAALEAALAHRLDEHFAADERPPTLDEMIETAGLLGVLGGYEKARNRRGFRGRTQSGIWRAHRIQFAGNHIIHSLPGFPEEEGAIRNAFEAVRDLTLVVSELFPPKATKHGSSGG